jgi:hypothetical protein
VGSFATALSSLCDPAITASGGTLPDKPMHPDPTYWRSQAARMLILAINTHDPDLSERLVIRASDYLDKALELERQQTAQLPSS